MNQIEFLRRFVIAILAHDIAWRLADAREAECLYRAELDRRMREARWLAERTIYPAHQFERGLSFGRTPKQLERCAMMSAMRGDARLNWWDR